MEAAWRKYPNPMNPAVTGIDVVDRQVSDGVLITKRLIASQWGLPGWAVSVRFFLCFHQYRLTTIPMLSRFLKF